MMEPDDAAGRPRLGRLLRVDSLGSRARRHRMVGRCGARPGRRPAQRPHPHHARTPPAGAPGPRRHGPPRHGRRPMALAAQARSGRGVGRRGRALAPPAPRRRVARADVHQAGSDHLLRRGPVPAGAGRGVQALPRSGAGRVVRGCPSYGRGRSRPAARGRLRRVRRDADRRRLDRPGPRRPPAQRRGGGRQGAATRRRPPRARRPQGDGVAGPASRRSDPRRRVGQPAGARRAVRRHDRRGARLPHRGSQHDRRRHDAARPRPDGLRRAPPPSRARRRAACS